MTNAKFTVTSKLMQNYETGSPVDYHNAIAATSDASGNLLFFSIGTDGHIYSFTSADDTTTGWHRTDLSQGMDDFTAVLLAAEQDENGAPLLAAVMRSNSTSEYSVFFTKDFAAATGKGRWVFRGKRGDTQVTNIAAGHGKGGAVLIVITAQQGDKSTNFVVNPNLRDQSWFWREVPSPVNSQRVISTAIGHNSRLEAAMDEVQGLLYSLYQTGAGGDTWMVLTSLPDFTYNHAIPLDFNPTAFGVTRGAQGDTELIVGDTKLYHLPPQIQTARDAGQVRQGLDPVTTQPTTHNLKSIEAGAMQDDLLEAWFLTEDGDLFRTYQGGDQQWVSPLPFQTEVGEMVAWRSDDKSLHEIFTADLNDRLRRYRQDPKTTLWKGFDILVESLDTHREIQTYVTQLQITDQYGAPMANQDVTVRASELTPLKINQSVYYAEPDSGGVVCQTDMLGNLTIENKVEGLSTPTLRLQADVLGSQLIDVDPAADVRQKLSTLTLDQLQNAQMQTDTIGVTQPMLAGKSPDDLQGAHQALQQLASNQFPSQRSSQSTRAFVAQAVGTPMLNRVPYGSLAPDYRWGLDLTGANPHFTTDQSRIERVHLAKRGTPMTAAALSTRSVLDDVEHFFGDVWHAIVNGLVELEHWVVQKVSDGIQFVISTAEKVYTVVVKFAEQVWSVIEYVFQQIGAFFEDLVRWLGFIFNWKDILVTHQVFVDGVNSMFQFGETEISVLEGYINDWCDQAEQELSSLQPFPSHIGDASVKDSADSAVAGVKAGDAGASFASFPGFISSDPAANWGNNQLQHSDMIGGTQDSQSSPGDQLVRAVTRFVDETLTAEVTNLETTINQVADDVKLAYDNNTLTPNQIVAQIAGDVLEGMIEAVRRLLIGLLELTKDLMEWFKALINDPIQIPLLTSLYENIIAPGSKLTLLDGVSLLAAIPVTVGYKLITGEAPFKEGDSVPVPSASLQAVGYTPQPAKARASARDLLMAAREPTQQPSDKGSSEGHYNPTLKVTSYALSILYSVSGFIGSVIDAYELLKVTQVEAFPERYPLLGDSDLTDRKKNIRMFRTVNRFMFTWCLIPFSTFASSQDRSKTDDKILPYQWVVFALGAFAVVKDVILIAREEENEKVISIADAVFALLTMIFEAVIFGIEIGEEDEYGDTDKNMKLAQYIFLTLGEVLGVPAAFVSDFRVKAGFVAGGVVGSTTGNVLNIVRMGMNRSADRLHRST